MNSAVVDQSTLVVVNIIVANPATDPPPYGCVLIELSDGEPCNIGWIYNSVTNTFSDPNLPSFEESVV